MTSRAEYGKMQEYIRRTIIRCKETVTLDYIKPLHRAANLHGLYSSRQRI